MCGVRFCSAVFFFAGFMPLLRRINYQPSCCELLFYYPMNEKNCSSPTWTGMERFSNPTCHLIGGQKEIRKLAGKIFASVSCRGWGSAGLTEPGRVRGTGCDGERVRVIPKRLVLPGAKTAPNASSLSCPVVPAFESARGVLQHRHPP